MPIRTCRQVSAPAPLAAPFTRLIYLSLGGRAPMLSDWPGRSCVFLLPAHTS